MITIVYNNTKEVFNNSCLALKRIKELESTGELVYWRCDEPEDNEYLWRHHK